MHFLISAETGCMNSSITPYIDSAKYYTRGTRKTSSHNNEYIRVFLEFLAIVLVTANQIFSQMRTVFLRYRYYFSCFFFPSRFQSNIESRKQKYANWTFTQPLFLVSIPIFAARSVGYEKKKNWKPKVPNTLNNHVAGNFRVTNSVRTEFIKPRAQCAS